MAEDLAAAISGSMGQLVGTMFTFPFDVVKTRMMAQTAKRGQMSVIAEMFKEDGVLGVYQRFPPKGLQQASTRFTYYYMYAFFSRQYLILTKTKQLGFWANLLIGYFVGVVNMIPSNPLELITNVIMNSSEQMTMTQVVSKVYNEQGFMGFYAGFWTTFFTSLNPALQNTLFDQIKVSYLVMPHGRT